MWLDTVFVYEVQNTGQVVDGFSTAALNGGVDKVLRIVLECFVDHGYALGFLQCTVANCSLGVDYHSSGLCI